MYRILEQNQEVRERRKQLRHPRYAAPELWPRLPIGSGVGTSRSFSKPSHTAQFQWSVTIHYRWHPLFGEMLAVKRPSSSSDGGRAFICLLPDGTWGAVPEWMTSRERCSRLTLVNTPEVSLGALLELRACLAELPSQSVSAKIRVDIACGGKETRRNGEDKGRGSIGPEVDRGDAVGGHAVADSGANPRSARRAVARRRNTQRAYRGGGR
jgi:hypothetical protein